MTNTNATPTAAAQATTPDLASYDVILINTSAGKDSLAMTDEVVARATELGIADRLVAVHCDLGRMEWAGTKELAHQQALRYGLPLHVVSREQDLLDQVAERGLWPGPTTRFCTSDHKRDQVAKLLTSMVNDWLERNYGRPNVKGVQVRILNCLGLRAQESDARKKKAPFERNKRATNGRRLVDNWLPIHDWTEEQVWERIRSKSLPYHRAYDLGMPRLSCVFCIFAPPQALALAGYHNPELLAQYVAVEAQIGHTFKRDLSLVQIQNQLAAGYVPAPVDGRLWKQCA